MLLFSCLQISELMAHLVSWQNVARPCCQNIMKVQQNMIVLWNSLYANYILCDSPFKLKRFGCEEGHQTTQWTSSMWLLKCWIISCFFTLQTNTWPLAYLQQNQYIVRLEIIMHHCIRIFLIFKYDLYQQVSSLNWVKGMK